MLLPMQTLLVGLMIRLPIGGSQAIDHADSIGGSQAINHANSIGVGQAIDHADSIGGSQATGHADSVGGSVNDQTSYWWQLGY